MKSFSQFPQATDLTNDDLLLISQWDGFSSYVTKYVTANLCESVSKKEFIAMIEQTGTSAPTITIIKDDFNDTYTSLYSAVGSYEISGFNNELLGDEEIYVNTNNLQIGTFIRTTGAATNVVYIDTADSSFAPSDNVISANTYIRVTKYL
jgi:hypothetical protein